MTEKLRAAAGLFGMITTSVFIVSTTYITFFWGINAAISVKVLWQTMAVSVLCSAVGLFLPSTKKEPSKKAMLIRNILCFVYENAVVLTCAWPNRLEMDTLSAPLKYSIEAIVCRKAWGLMWGRP